MREIPGTGPLGWVHLRLAGGWLALCGIALGYAILIGSIILLTAWATDSSSRRGLFQGWSIFLVMLQVGILLVLGASRISSVIRHDITTHMIESHRLMPIHPAQAILGYLFGAPAIPVGIALANLGLSLALAGPAGRDPDEILTFQALILALAILVWTMVALAALSVRFIVPLIIIGFMLSLPFSELLFMLVPGWTVLGGPLMAWRTYVFGISRSTLSPVNVVSILSELVVAGLFFHAATRKYRVAAAPAFSPWTSLLLLLVWVILSLVGMTYIEEFRAGLLYNPPGDWRQGLIASLLSTLLIGLIPLAGAAWSADHPEVKHRRTVRDQPVIRVMLVIILTFGVVLPSRWNYPQDLPGWQLSAALTLLIVVVFDLTYVLVLRTARALRIPGAVPAFGWLAVLVGGPVAVDLIRYAYYGLDGPMALGPVAAISPAGAIAEIWMADSLLGAAAFGVAVQAFVAAVGAALYYFIRPMKEPSPRLTPGDAAGG